MEQRQDVEEAIVGGQRECLAGVVCRGTNIDVSQGHTLRPRGRSRRMEDQGDVVGLGPVRRSHTRVRHSAEGVQARLRIACGFHFEYREAARMCDCARRRVHARPCQQGLRLEIGEIEGKVARSVAWIEWRTGSAGAHGEKRHGHFWTARQHDSNAIVTAESHRVERLRQLLDVQPEALVCERCAPGSQDRHGVGRALSLVGQESRNRQPSGRIGIDDV